MTRYQKLIILFLAGVIIGLAVSLVVVKRREDIARARRIHVYFLEYDHEVQMPLLRPFFREITYTRELPEKVMLAFGELSIGPGEDLGISNITSSYPQGVVPDSVSIDGDLV